LAQQFPGDPGAMAPLFLNYLLIAPGESFFMAANEPHAYVAGEIIECMACSDNVVRIGQSNSLMRFPKQFTILNFVYYRINLFDTFIFLRSELV
jgi:mannose-6-phosphate isomerase